MVAKVIEMRCTISAATCRANRNTNGSMHTQHDKKFNERFHQICFNVDP